MRLHAAAPLILACASLAAQNAAYAPPTAEDQRHASHIPATEKTGTAGAQAAITDANLGFRYSLNADWSAEPLPVAASALPYPAAEGQKKGNACAHVELTARHGNPYSVVVVIALPFDCYGQSLTERDLESFVNGASEGLKQAFEVTGAALSNYRLGRHTVWIERASASVKGQPDAKYTLELACTLLAKGAACWMTMAANQADLQTFERASVVLEGDKFGALVPEGAVSAFSPTAKSPP